MRFSKTNLLDMADRCRYLRTVLSLSDEQFRELTETISDFLSQGNYKYVKEVFMVQAWGGIESNFPFVDSS